MPPREISLSDLDGILRIPDSAQNTEETIKSWVQDMVKFLLTLSWKDQKPN